MSHLPRLVSYPLGYFSDSPGKLSYRQKHEAAFLDGPAAAEEGDDEDDGADDDEGRRREVDVVLFGDDIGDVIEIESVRNADAQKGGPCQLQMLSR